VSLLAQDAVWSMPPLGDWYRGATEIAVFLARAPLNGRWHWRHRPAHASGQAAVGSYTLRQRRTAPSRRSPSTC
jgi:RNA polymerase sigma-70 factor (ECF subfamily)